MATKLSSSSLLPKRSGPAIAILFTVSIATGAVYYSHYAQSRDKAVMREGVERDKERIRMIRRKQKLLQQQKQQQQQES